MIFLKKLSIVYVGGESTIVHYIFSLTTYVVEERSHEDLSGVPADVRLKGYDTDLHGS